jgi:hypothetical protein
MLSIVLGAIIEALLAGPAGRLMAEGLMKGWTTVELEDQYEKR